MKKDPWTDVKVIDGFGEYIDIPLANEWDLLQNAIRFNDESLAINTGDAVLLLNCLQHMAAHAPESERKQIQLTYTKITKVADALNAYAWQYIELMEENAK